MPHVRFNVTHTHAGVAYPAGHRITVDDHTARWLSERAIATLVTANSEPAAKDAAAMPVTPSPTPRFSKSTKE